MNEIMKHENKPTMTIKEVAYALKKDESTIRKIGKTLFPGMFKNGKKTYLNEKQVTAIKLNLGKNSELPKTDLEKELIIQQAMLFQNEKINDLHKQLEDMKPKALFYDTVKDSKGALAVGKVAKVIEQKLGKKVIGRNNLFKFLRSKGILQLDNVPYQTYINRGYFRVIEKEYENPKTGAIEINTKTLVLQKGIDYIIKLLQREYA